jgi:hypothetical protein
MQWRDLGLRVVVLVLTAVVVVGVVAGPSLMERENERGGERLENPEYDPDTVVPEQPPARGTIDPDPDPGADENGTVLIDRGHGNRFTRADIEPVVDALVRQGYEIEFYTEGDMATHLEDADAFLVIDPSEEYLPGDVNDIRSFTANGGRLVMVGEPDRITVSANLFGTSLQTTESRLTTLASAYGMAIDTRYLYNQENADGTYKHVIVRAAEDGKVDDVERGVMYTPAAVTARDGTVLLRAAPATHKSSTDEVTGEYPVAVRTENTLLLGDTTMMGANRYNVADNEQILAHVVEFLIEGDHQPASDDD